MKKRTLDNRRDTLSKTSKDELHQQHISLPEMQQRHDCKRNRLRNAVAPVQNGDIFQAIDYQHSENRRRKCAAQILNVLWRGLVGTEDQERQKTGQHGRQ